ncbi:MAG: ribonuclease P protein component [candidate division KSB1 bacterium]|nr:ribonuclease P protein component [candidate division KSB1 bacterium]
MKDNLIVSQKFPKALILKKSRDIYQVIHHGKRYQSECFTAFYKKNDEVKFAFTVNSKIKKKPQRNRLKRKIREAVRKTFRRYELKSSIVFIASANAETEQRKLEQEVEKLFNEIQHDKAATL